MGNIWKEFDTFIRQKFKYITDTINVWNANEVCKLCANYQILIIFIMKIA